MATSSRSVTVGTTAIRLFHPEHHAGDDPSVSSVLNNSATATLYLGGADVTDANGYPLSPGSSYDVDLTDGDDLYCVASAADTDVRVLETNH